MNQINLENLERQIKKNIYGKPQKAKLFYPPGFGETALQELKTILAHLWFPQNSKNECVLNAKYIELAETHISVLTEVLLRTKCLSDIHLVLTEEKCKGKEEFKKICNNIKWNYYLNNNINVKIKVNSTASKAFHETGLKEIANPIIIPFIQGISTGEHSNEDTIINFELYKDKLTVSMSLVGQPLYKRGYKKELKTLAPLREDLAACCIQKYFNDLKKNNIILFPDKVYVPFAGSGTFAFESHFYFENIANHYFHREFIFKKLPFFKKENYNYLLKKAAEENSKTVKQNNYETYCIDTSESAVKKCKENNEKYLSYAKNISNIELKLEIYNKDFFKNNTFITKNGFKFLFIPLNPPYGLRITNKQNAEIFYKRIAQTLNHLKEHIDTKDSHIGGFILCPNEETWSIFYNTLNFNLKDTYHFTQGGLDIRVCQFFI